MSLCDHIVKQFIVIIITYSTLFTSIHKKLNQMDQNNNNNMDENGNNKTSPDSSSISSNEDGKYDTRPQEKEQIERVRAKFLERTDKKPEQFYEQDIDLVKTNEWWTLRFIKWHKGNEDKALKQMINAFKWRKSFGLYERNVNDIPNEFAKAAAFFPYGFDRKGRPMIYIRVKVYRKIQQLNIFFQQFVVGIVNHIDALGGRKGYAFVFDVTGMGIINIDFDFLQFLVQLIQNYYPYGLRYAICYNVPKVVRPLWSVAKIFLGSSVRTFQFCNTREELLKFIPPQWLLRYMGGECDFDFTDFEEVRGAPSVREVGPKYGFTPAEIEKYYKIFEGSIAEAALLSKGQPV